MDTCPAKTLSESFTIKVKLALIHHQLYPVGGVKNTLRNPPSVWEIPMAQCVSVVRLVVVNKTAFTVEKTSRKSDFAQEMCSLCVTDSLVTWAVENQNFALKKSLSQCLESSVLFTASSWCLLGTVTSLLVKEK